MNAPSRIRIRAGLLSSVVALVLAGFNPAVAAAETVMVKTGGWQIHKPSKEYKDLPTLLPKQENGSDAGIGLFEFVCMKSSYFMLLVQPTAKLRDTEPAMVVISVRAADAANGAPTALTFRNLYKTKSLLSRSLDWDADIHYAEIGVAQLESFKTASELELTLAGRSYAIALSDLGSRLGSFQRFCEKGVVENPAHFEKP